MPDETPARIRWQTEPGVYSGFSGYVGTIEQALFRIYDPEVPDADHLLTSMLPATGNSTGYGTEAEVKRQAEEWLAGHVASLGAVFRPFAFTRDELADALTRIELRVSHAGPIAGKVNAESMADAIIQALEEASG